MKKVLALMLALCMVFLMAACAGTTKTDSTTGRPRTTRRLTRNPLKRKPSHSFPLP